MMLRNLIFISLVLGASYSVALLADDASPQETKSPEFPSYVISFCEHAKDCYKELKKRNPDIESFTTTLHYNYGYRGFSEIVYNDNLRKSIEHDIQEASAAGDDTLALIYKATQCAIEKNDRELKGFLVELFNTEMFSNRYSWLPRWWKYTQRAAQISAGVTLAYILYLDFQQPA